MELQKTSLRTQYEEEVLTIKSEIGDLENIRNSLGLSARKMTQLLMVDPSAWTRWTKQGQQAPPHIWRALHWYMTLRDKNPQITATNLINQAHKDPQQWDKKTQELEGKIQTLEHSIRAQKVMAVMFAIAALIFAFAFYKLLR